MGQLGRGGRLEGSRGGIEGAGRLDVRIPTGIGEKEEIEFEFESMESEELGDSGGEIDGPVAATLTGSSTITSFPSLSLSNLFPFLAFLDLTILRGDHEVRIDGAPPGRVGEEASIDMLGLVFFRKGENAEELVRMKGGGGGSESGGVTIFL
jgi:hypothetical protein